jgi:hypothetical protein
MIPVVAGGLRETSLVPEDLPPLRRGKSSGTKLVSLNPPATTGIIRPRKDNILSGMSTYYTYLIIYYLSWD